MLTAAVINAETFVVTRTDDRNAVCVSGVDCSLREAVSLANSLPSDDVINFSGISSVTLTNEISITNNGTLAINGTGANVLTIDGGAGTNRIFFIDSATVIISGMTLTGGNGRDVDSSLPGGAIRCIFGSLTLDGVYVTNNSADSGGGVYFLLGSHRIINSTFSRNTISGYFGGGIRISGGSLEIVNSTISGNIATEGGGLHNDGANTTLRNVTITNNIATVGGGGIRTELGTLNIGNTIVTGNTAISGVAPEIRLAESFGTVISAGNNLIGDSAGDSTNTEDPITYQSTDIRDTPPILGPLQNNGGTTPTHALLFGSPAVNRGNNSLVTLLTDQRGFARISGGTVDIGAYELQLGTTAATVAVSGHVVTQSGQGIGNITVTMTGSNWQARTATTDSLGFYNFQDAATGETYVLSASDSHYRFLQPSQVVNVNDEGNEVNFVALPLAKSRKRVRFF